MKFREKSISKLYAFALAAVFALTLAGCGGGGGTAEEPPPMPTPQEMCADAGNSWVDGACLTPAQVKFNETLAAIMAATTAEAAQAAYDAVKDDVSASDGEKLQAAVDERVGALAMMARAEEQKMALTMAAADLGAIDLEDLDTAEKIAAANDAIEALKMALANAADVSDEDKAMYQTQLDEAGADVRMAQTGLNTQERMAAQRTEINNAASMARTAVAGVSDTSTDSEVAAADAAVQAVKDAIAAAADLLEDDAAIIAANAVLETIEPLLAKAKTSRMEYLAKKGDEDMKANTALGKALHAALGGPQAGNALANIATQTLSATGLDIDAAQGAGALGDSDDAPGLATLKAGDSAGALGSWNGMDYAQSSGTGDSKVTNEARVYTNRGPAGTQPFNDKHPLHEGSLTVTNFDLVMAAAFTHQGTQDHAVPKQQDAVYIKGTYDGAPGTFRCQTSCSSTNDGKGSPNVLGGTWTFEPEKGAMVSKPDANYLYYGWWVSKDNDGEPTAASAFTGIVGDVDGDQAAVNGGSLTGSATYVGKAVGKFAMSNPLDGTGNGGHFTADAELKATFGSGATAGMTGTIDNFRLNDGSEDPGWGVSLARGTWAADGEITAPSEKPTVWSINGNKAPASGTWSGTMYDEMPGGAPDGDGNNIPTTVTGTFYSEFSTIGRMVGAFGANKQ